MGQYLLNNLKTISDDRIVDVRGKGLMIGMQFENSFDVKKYMNTLRGAGLLTKDTKGNTLRLTPPLVIN